MFGFGMNSIKMKKVNNMKNLRRLKEEILSEDPDIREKASQSLSKTGDKQVVDFLISLLENKNAGIRNSAALTLKEIGDNRAVNPLMKAIMHRNNKDNRGTLVHALEGLDCSQLFLPMVNLALLGNYEVQCHALAILKEQSFKVVKDEIVKVHRMIEEYLRSNKKCQNHELLIGELRRYTDRVENEFDTKR